MPHPDRPTRFGITAIATYQPEWLLSNDWFGESMPKKFAQHTGILSRTVAQTNEVTLAVKATERLVAESGCCLDHCAAVVFNSPSFIPMSVARRHLDRTAAKQEQLARACNCFARTLGIKPRLSFSTNSFCCGYARAISIVANKLGRTLDLAAHEFILVVTATRISRITNYSNLQTGPLFGDMATATLIASLNSQYYPPKFEIVAAHVNKQSTNRPFFDFEMQENGVQPDPAGGTTLTPNRVVFKLDGMAIADAAPRAMANAASKLAHSVGLDPQDVQFIIPHQAGAAIVRFTEMKLRENGFSGEVINGLTRDVGNVSASSIPFAIQQNMDRLSGNIVCPAASVGQPGENHVMEGGVLLRRVA